jgi:hypothetical protein
MHRWVGLGVIADNLVNIGRAMEQWIFCLIAPATFGMASSACNLEGRSGAPPNIGHKESPGARPGLSVGCRRESERARDFQAAEPLGVAVREERIALVRIEVAMPVVVGDVDHLDADIKILDR